MATELDLPLVLHIVEAHASALAMLSEHHPQQAVVHYFQGDSRLAEAYVDLGCYISVGKPIIRPENTALREAVSQVPLERLLLETDTYPLPGRTTEPCNVLQVCQAVAELHGLEAGEVAQATTWNFQRVFLKKRSPLYRLGIHDN